MGNLIDYLLHLKKNTENSSAIESLDFKNLSEIENFFGPVLGPNVLLNEEVQKHLLTFEEFKNVKKINVLQFPSYFVNKETGKFANYDEDNLGDKSNYRIALTQTRAISPGEFEFAEEIDIYSIDLTPPMYDLTKLSTINLGPGVWIMPTTYNSVDFTPLKEIRVVFSPEGLQDIMFDKTKEEVDKILEERILKNVKEALYSKEPNVPAHRKILIRASERSIIIKNN